LYSAGFGATGLKKKTIPRITTPPIGRLI
jgi:hypothetical protein